MMEWVNAIYDRTESDVVEARALIEHYKANGGMTINTTLKGCLNAGDLNRIENNIDYLNKALCERYYFCNASSVLTWSIYSIPRVAHSTRITGNVSKLISAYYKPPNSPSVPSNMTHYSQINDIEKTLHLLKEMIEHMDTLYRRCGTFSCGEG